MIPSIQRILLSLGESGCYFLSMLWLSEMAKGRQWNVVAEFADMKALGYVGEDGYVLDASAAFTLLMHERWECVKAGDTHPLLLNYQLKKEEREVLRYEYTDTAGKTHAHFVAGDGRGGVAFDPMGTSESVKQGRVVSRRIFRRL